MFNFFRRKYVIKTAMNALNISKHEAEKRVDALLKSGIMEEGSPDDLFTQLRIENFLRFDLSKLDYTDAHLKTINFPAFVSFYDKKQGTHLAKALNDVKSDNYIWPDVKEQIELFDKFFCKYIWNYFPNVIKYNHE